MSTSLADSKRLPADQVNQPYPGVSNARVFLLIAFVAFGGFLFGYDCIIGGQLLDMQSFARDFGTPQEPDGKPGFITAVRGLFISILSIGTFCGALTAPFICDNVGRRWGIIITCVIFSVGIAIQAGARIIHVLMVGRVIAGFGVGLVSVMVPLYQSECSPPKRRGTMVSCYQLAITIGLLIGQIVTYVTHKMESADAYRIPIALQFAWSGILGVGMFLLPETPRYLIKVGKWDDAVKAKTRLTGLAPDHPLVLDELAEIKGNYEHELNMGQSGYKDCFKGTNLRRTLLGIFMQAWQQVTGVNFIFYFGVMFFQSAGIGDPFKIAMVMGTINCLCTFPGLYLIEKVGRRKLLLWGAVVQLTSHFLVGIIYTATNGTKPVWTAVFTGTFIAAFAASWGPCAWVITSEMFGLKTRAKQMSFASAGNWGFNTLLGQVAPMISGDLQHPVLGVKVAFLWGALNVGCWAYVYFFIPELRGLHLEQVDEMFETKVPAWHSAAWKPTVSYRDRVQSHELEIIDKEHGTVTILENA